MPWNERNKPKRECCDSDEFLSQAAECETIGINMTLLCYMRVLAPFVSLQRLVIYEPTLLKIACCDFGRVVFLFFVLVTSFPFCLY